MIEQLVYALMGISLALILGSVWEMCLDVWDDLTSHLDFTDNDHTHHL